MMAIDLYADPGPWHASHWTPSFASNVLSIAVAAPVTVWHWRHSGDSAAGFVSPFFFATASAAGVRRALYASECFVLDQTPNWLPVFSALWQGAHILTPTYLLAAQTPWSKS